MKEDFDEIIQVLKLSCKDISQLHPPFNSFLNVISCYKTKYLFQTTFLAQEATNGF